MGAVCCLIINAGIQWLFSNEFRNITGDSSTGNYRSGFGILVLDATNVTAFGNLIVNCVTGIAFGNKGPGQSSNIHNNTLSIASKVVYLVGGANNTTNVVRNNIFTTSNKTLPAVKVDSAAWTGELLLWIWRTIQAYSGSIDNYSRSTTE